MSKKSKTLQQIGLNIIKCVLVRWLIVCSIAETSPNTIRDT